MVAPSPAQHLAQLQDALDVLLGNPYRDGVVARRLALDRTVCGPDPRRNEAELATAWRAWWGAVPDGIRRMEPIAFGLALCLGAGAERDQVQLKAVARELPEEARWPCIELSVRSAEVRKAIDRITGRSDLIRRVQENTWRAAFGERLDHSAGLAAFLRSTPVLILGETGTGKELVAEALKAATPGTRGKNDTPMPANHHCQTVHLASVPEGLVESTLFGHEKGAFTGATAAQEGVLRRCHQGAVCLDEVAELPLKTQVALLRALEVGEVLPVGATKEVPAAPRVFSATHQALERLVNEGRFREDLFHRLSSVIIRVPPLRDRRGDIPAIYGREIAAIAQELRPEVKERFDAFIERNKDYSWPGNVRELKKVLRALALGFEPDVRVLGSTAPDGVPPKLVAGTMTLDEAKEWYARHVVQRHDGNISQAARILDVERITLRKLMPEKQRGA